MLKKIILILFFCSLCCPAAFAAEKTEELLADLDIPLAKGLVERAEARVMFDSPEGRIVTAEAGGEALPAKVFDFYQLVLPSLGWKIVEDDPEKPLCKNQNLHCIKARRDKENLFIRIMAPLKNRRITMVTYSLDPQ